MTNQQLPTAEHEERFWALLEAAWEPLGGQINEARRHLAARAPGETADVADLEKAISPVLENLATACADLSPAELTDLDRVVERKLYDIDRKDIHAVTGGSDDGFLYARGFVVALGRGFYDAVSAEPRLAVADGESGEMAYFFSRLHQARTGDYPKTGGASRESFSSAAGWL